MNDRNIARRSLNLQSRARDFRMLDIPGYLAWSKRKLAENESEAFIAHLDATFMWLLPEEIESIAEKDFNEMLEDLRASIGEGD